MPTELLIFEFVKPFFKLQPIEEEVLMFLKGGKYEQLNGKSFHGVNFNENTINRYTFDLDMKGIKTMKNIIENIRAEQNKI